MKGRFAPSPTGYMHLGNLWIALLSYVSVRRQGGSFLLRIEDIDLQRSKAIYTEGIMEDLRFCGIEWDEEPLFQSQRQEIYENYLREWEKKGMVYPCYCNRTRLHSISSGPHLGEGKPVYDGYCRHLSDTERTSLEEELATHSRKPHYRLKVSDVEIAFEDRWNGFVKEPLVAGTDDVVLKRGDGMYAYQLAVSIDDYESGVTEVIRGYDLLGSTGIQIYLQRLLGNPHFIRYGHAPLLMDEEGNRLSKRQQGITIRELKNAGMEREDILGYLAHASGVLPVKAGEKVSIQDWIESAAMDSFSKMMIIVK